MRKQIVIADDEPITRMDISEILEEAGYDVVGTASDGFDAIELCRKYKPDLAILDIKMPLLNGLKASMVINEEKLAKGIVLLTAYSGKEFIEEAKEVGVLGYIVKPISERVILPTVEVAIAKGEEIENIKRHVEDAREEIEKRKLIERAKGILMTKYNMTEQEAFIKIRKLSMDKRCSMKNIAQVIILND